MALSADLIDHIQPIMPDEIIVLTITGHLFTAPWPNL